MDNVPVQNDREIMLLEFLEENTQDMEYLAAVPSSNQMGAQLVIASGRPVLGICYGMQLLTYHLGGKVDPSDEREYGPAEIDLVDAEAPIFSKLPADDNLSVWMSHGDRVTRLPEGFEVIAVSRGAPFAAIAHEENKFYGLQFHPEVVHTEGGTTMLANFAHGICGCPGSWTMY